MTIKYNQFSCTKFIIIQVPTIAKTVVKLSMKGSCASVFILSNTPLAAVTNIPAMMKYA